VGVGIASGEYVLLFGVLSVIVIIDQFGELF
jgi:hypothetical protein